ncbi:MAG: hypothetical protein DRO06_01970 [Thermoproteota archaeon]|nr:MAG: hypothetical protein DRO06_01970 [Candidatus Korarchaeota archaeon]
MEERAGATVSDYLVDCRWFQPVRALVEARIRWEKLKEEKEKGEEEKGKEVEEEEGGKTERAGGEEEKGREKKEKKEEKREGEEEVLKEEPENIPTGLCTLGVKPGGWVSPEFCAKCSLRVPRGEERPHQLEIERIRGRLLLGEEPSKLSWGR